jgi:Fe-Mn family superoxide dismutase
MPEKQIRLLKASLVLRLHNNRVAKRREYPMTQASYTAKTFNMSGLKGISDETLKMHFGLYEGYVKNTNLLLEQISAITRKKQASGQDPAYAELTRRLGFEFGGMVLHEYYFENLAPKGKGSPSKELTGVIEGCFETFENWQKAFSAVGEMRGVGWAILYQDPVTEQLSNHWIALHQDGVPSGFKPILVMDVWEHAFLLDYKPAERPKYIEAFFANIDWEAVHRRLTTPAAVRAVA